MDDARGCGRVTTCGFWIVLFMLTTSVTAPAQSVSTSSGEVSAGEAASEPGTVSTFLRDVGGDYKHFFSKETAFWLGAAAAPRWPFTRPTSRLPTGCTPTRPRCPADPCTDRSSCRFRSRSAGGSPARQPGATGRQPSAATSCARRFRSSAGRTPSSSRPTARGRTAIRDRFRPATRRRRSRPRWCCRNTSAGRSGLPAFAAAAYTGVSRVAANQHWASDVVFGAARRAWHPAERSRFICATRASRWRRSRCPAVAACSSRR